MTDPLGRSDIETIPEFITENWNRYDLSSPFNLSATLKSGQTFRWRQDEAGVWRGVIGDCLAALYQKKGDPDSPLYWRTYPNSNEIASIEDYFRLGVDLQSLYDTWSNVEPAMIKAVRKFRGLRILRQPPVECFFGFQCATCNTVVKIERSVRKLAERYGETVFPEDELFQSDAILYHRFPTLAALAEADESLLRADLWGYRAPRVIDLAKRLLTLPDDWLLELRTKPHLEVRDALTQMHGIGSKLADCIALFSLDKDEATPVDTHVRQITCELFLPELSGKSLTPRVYDAVVEAWQSRFGSYAGWAQQYLFFAKLKR